MAKNANLKPSLDGIGGLPARGTKGLASLLSAQAGSDKPAAPKPVPVAKANAANSNESAGNPEPKTADEKGSAAAPIANSTDLSEESAANDLPANASEESADRSAKNGKNTTSTAQDAASSRKTAASARSSAKNPARGVKETPSRKDASSDRPYVGITTDPESIQTSISIAKDNLEYMMQRILVEDVSITEFINTLLADARDRLSGKRRDEIVVDEAAVRLSAASGIKTSRRMTFDPELHQFLKRCSRFHGMSPSGYLNYLLASERLTAEKSGAMKKWDEEVL